MHKAIISLLLYFVVHTCGQAQKPFELGAEYIRSLGQGYNHAKAALRSESFSNKNSFSLGLTYQLSSKKAYSVSHGFGLYIGYRYSFSIKNPGNSPFAGARVLFSLENFEGQTNQNSLFITPWAEAGYHFMFAKNFFAAPSVGYGKTFKISKDYHSLDEDNGTRIFPSLSAGYRF
jgi:hypothetical protein